MSSATSTTAPSCTAKDDATMKEWTKEDLNRHLLELLRRQRNRDSSPPPPRSSVSAMEEQTVRPAMMLRSTTDAPTSSTSGEPTINSEHEEKDIADDDTVSSPCNDDSPRVSSPSSSSSWLIKTLLLSSSNFSSKTYGQQLDDDTDEKAATHFLFEDIVTTATSIVESDGPQKNGRTSRQNRRLAWYCHGSRLFRTAGLCFVLLFLVAYVQIIPLVLLSKTSSSLSTTTRPNRLEPKNQGPTQGPNRRKAVTVATTTPPQSSNDHYDCTRSNCADDDPQVTMDGLGRGGSSVQEDLAVVAGQDLFHPQGVAAGQIFCEQLLPDLSPATVAWCAMHLLL
jgi:hypothetical protein